MVSLVLLVLPGSMLLPGDTEFARGDYPAAIAVYDSLLGHGTDSSSVSWRLARAYVCLGDIAPRGEKMEHYKNAERYARETIRCDSSMSAGYSWLAAALGNIAMREGAGEKVRLSREIKSTLDKAILLNDSDDVAYSILGSFYRALCNVSWLERQLANLLLGGLPEGGCADAERALRRAIELAPGSIRHHFELGLTYLESDRPSESQAELRLVMELPAQLSSDAARKERARGLLAEMSATDE